MSIDTVDSHKQFCENEGLLHTLLADAKGEVATSYGVKNEKGYASRTTFVIDPNGKVAAVFPNVDPTKSAKQILDFVAKQDPASMIVAPLAIGLAVPDFSLKGTDGKTYTLSDTKASKGILVLFMSARCPVCRVYEERIKKLAADYKPFTIYAVDANAEEIPDEQAAYSERIGLPLLRDDGATVVHEFRARVTPEAFLLAPDLKLVYQGCIDDQTEPSAVTKSPLREAMTALSEGKPVSVKRSRAFGCLIERE